MLDHLKTAAATVMVVVALFLIFEFFARPHLPGPGNAITSAQADRMLAELQAIRKTLESGARGVGAPQRGPRPRPPAGPVTVSLEGKPFLGRAKAPLTMVEFTDYQCPFCRRYHQQTFPDIKKNYIDTGKLRYVVADLPLGIHPNAPGAAQAVHCAGEQGKLWAMQDTLFANQGNLAAGELPGHAEKLGLDMAKFRACLADDKHTKMVRAGADEAQRLGITGTPSFVVGKTGDGKRLRGEKLVGAQPYAAFEAVLKRAAGGG